MEGKKDWLGLKAIGVFLGKAAAAVVLAAALTKALKAFFDVLREEKILIEEPEDSESQ